MPYFILPKPWMDTNKKMQSGIEIFVDADLSISVEDLVYHTPRESGGPQ